VDRPMYYRSSITDDERYYKEGEFIHFGSMPLPGERDMGMGMCAVDRALRAAKLLLAVHDYDEQKLSNLPPEGVASVTGLTAREFQQAIQLWKAARESRNSLTFPQVLWLVGSNPGAKVSVSIESFSALPESFDRETVVTHYVNTLALCFGMDAREFWTMSSAALGTAAETEMQHLKARGKGGGEFITLVESKINAELPEGVVFRFDTQDIEEDMTSAKVAEAWINALIKLVYPPQPQYEQDAVIPMETFKRLLADKGVLPEWAISDDRIAITGHEVHKEEMEDLVKVIWRAGNFTRSTITRMAVRKDLSQDAQDAIHKEQIVAQLPEPQMELQNIRGTPISDDEVDRGTRITSKSMRSALDMWKDVPELAAYVPEA
jgi:hypothetical protein